MEKAHPSLTLTDRLRVFFAPFIAPIAAFVGKLGVHPNTITLSGFLLTLGVAGVLSQGYWVAGGILLLFTSSLDALDGAVARTMQTHSRFGAFLDSTLDRLSEGAIYLGLLHWLLGQNRQADVYWLFLALLGSVMISYTRARAEGVGLNCKVGLATRVERVLLTGVLLILQWITPLLILLAVLTWITVVQRVLYVYREAQKTGGTHGEKV